MRHFLVTPCLAVLGGLIAGGTMSGGSTGGEAQDPEGAVPVAKQAIAAMAPLFPEDVVADLQAGRYEEAAAKLERLGADAKWSADDRAYVALVRGTAFRLAKRLDDARGVLSAAIDKAPQGPWSAKLRSELVAVELASGRFEAAESIARAEAERLLAGDRKDRLSLVYRDYARRLLEPAEPTTPADPEGAFALLSQARDLAKGEALRASLLVAMGEASQKAGNPGRAIENFQAYLREYPKGEDRTRVRYLLGEAQLASGQPLPARLTWSDLVRDLETVDDKDAQKTRGDALFQISRTYGLPAPGDDTSLNLGVASLKRLLEAYPAHPWSVRAAFDIATAYNSRGKSEAALDALRAFLEGMIFQASTDEARAEQAQLQMSAQFLTGQILQGQEKFGEAIEAWKAYLAKYPNGPQSADAQRAILDTQLLIAADHLRKEEYDKARAAWQLFVTQNPLDGRVPQILFDSAASFAREKKFDEAIAAWATLAGKFPDTEPAAHGQFESASIYEVEKGELSEAIERFKKITVEPWASQARQRIAVMESKALTVVTPRAFRSGETAHLKIATRNIEKLTFTAYKLDSEAYFLKKHAVTNVEGLDIGLVQPDAEWTADVPGYDKYKPIDKEYELPKLELPGVYVVKVTDEKTLQATTLVLGSDIDAVVKVSRDQILVFVQDMKTGEGRSGARVLVSDGQKVILQEKTGPDGVLLTKWAQPRDPGSGLTYLILDGPHVAGSGLGVPGQVAQGLSPRAYLYTDRPAYRPGDSVELRGIVREVEKGQYANRPGAAYKLEIFDSRGRQFVARPVTLSDFGTFATTVQLDSGTPVGSYRIRLYQPGKSDFAGQFEVQAYQLEKIDLSFDLPRTVFFRGEKVEAKLTAKYQYGTPLAGREIEVSLPDGRTIQGKTDAAGQFAVEFPTEGFAEEQALALVARLPQDNVATTAMVRLAIRAFLIGLSTSRDVYLDGESFPLTVTTTDALGKPNGETLNLAILKRVEQAGRTVEREVRKLEVKTDAKTGKASVPVKVDDADGGTFILRVAGTDRFGNPIVEDRALLISGKKDDQKLRLLADRLNYMVGETARINLHSRLEAGRVLVCWEADQILQYKLVDTKEGDNPLEWPVEAPQFPNFTLTAARMAATRFHETQLNVRVERDLRVEIKPVRAKVGPGEDVEVEVTAVDQLGRPVESELSLALVDKALLRLFGDRAPAIGPFFYDQTRLGAFSTTATNTFGYHPPTVAVAEALVEDQEQLIARLGDEQARGAVMMGLEVAKAEPAPGPTAGFTDWAARGDRAADAMRGMGMGGGGLGGQAAMMGRPEAGGMYQALATRAPGAPAPAMDAAFSPDGSVLAETAGGVALDDRTESLSLSKAVRLRAGALARRKAYWGFAKAEADQPREQFVETAYWNPSVKTGADGKGTVTFKAPTALSEYQFTARGVTGAETLVGQSTADFSVHKEFFVDIKLPASLTEGDKPRFIAQLHHTGVRGKAEVILSVYAGGQEQKYPKTLDLKEDGVEDLLFDRINVPNGDLFQVHLEARAENASDVLNARLPIRPWGVQSMASAAGTAGDDATVSVGLPEGRAYESAEMVIVLAPTLRRMLVELALGRDFYILDTRIERCIWPPIPNTVADRASDLLGASATLAYLRQIGGAAAPEASRLAEKARGGVSELVTLQNDDGGWPSVPATPEKPQASDAMTSAMALWALAEAEKLGLMTDNSLLDRGSNHLTQEYARIDSSDQDTRATVLHALSTRGKASFEQVNGFGRNRQSLSDMALAYLALTFANIERPTLAAEVLNVLGPRAKSENVAPGIKPRRYWDGAGRAPWSRTPVETTGLAALAYARVAPADTLLAGAIEWLLAHRMGTGWLPHRAKGPALAALAGYYGRGQEANDRYRLAVTVNENEVSRLEVDGRTEGQAIRVPLAHIKPVARNRVHFDFEGRGTFGYAITLSGFTRDFGPDQNRANRPFVVHRRVYWAPEPMLDGKPLAQGFGVALNPQTFENTVSQLALGGKITISLEAWRNQPAGQPAWERDLLVLEEHLPAGTSLVEGSVQSAAAFHEYGDGVLRLYFTPDQWPSATYEVFGYIPGDYRALPTILRSAYDPGRLHLGPEGKLAVLAPGEKSTDPYKATPDELYARGKGLFDTGRLAEAAGPLESLWDSYTLREDVAKDAARMLLTIHIKNYDPRRVVKYFEVLKEKSPELVIPFEDIRVVGRAYADIGEHERAYLVWRATAEASYLEDARVGEVLRQRAKTLEGLAFLLELWREYPNGPSYQTDFFGLSSILGNLATRAYTETELRRELARAEVTRTDLLAQQIRLIQIFLCLSPENPIADEASLALVGAFLDLEDFKRVVALAERFAGLYPRSRFLDSFLYSQALGHFHLGEYDPAVKLAERIAAATYKDESGVDQPSPNKWEAIYILGQIHDARHQSAKAVEYYTQVADRFGDAASAVASLSRKELKLPEVAVVRPKGGPEQARVEPGPSGVGLRSIQLEAPKADGTPDLDVSYRNLSEIDLKVYAVDLMRLYLTRRNLDGITGIDLAGIQPLVEQTIKLGSGDDYEDMTKGLDLPLTKEGAYLVMARGENLYASGIVLITPLELEVLEEAQAGRVRVRVRDARTKAFLPKVQVKVIGSNNARFLSGETDLRGVFVAEGVQGVVTAVARKDLTQYAFYRGKSFVGQPPAPTAAAPEQVPAEGKAEQAQQGQGLDKNLKDLNFMNSTRQLERLQERYNLPAPSGGVQVEQAK